MLRKALRLLVVVIVPLSLQAQTYNVMTYNIRYDTPNDGVNQWPLRKQKVCDLIKKYDPDIIGLQEALQHQIEDILQALPDYTYVGVGRDDGKTKGEYSPVLFKKSKFEIKDQSTFWLSPSPAQPGSKGWDAAITRVATWCRLKDLGSKKTFLIVNTHFDHMGKEARANSALLLTDRAYALGKKMPVIVMGDFNCKREDPPYQNIMAATRMKLLDPAPKNAPGTFCNFEVNSMECVPIDYIFVTPGWLSENYQVITDNDGKYYPSDHLPVMVTVTMKK